MSGSIEEDLTWICEHLPFGRTIFENNGFCSRLYSQCQYQGVSYNTEEAQTTCEKRKRLSEDDDSNGPLRFV